MMPSKRFSHYLRPVNGGHWPQHILCVDCIGHIEEQQGSNIVRIESLESWHASLLVRNSDRYSVKYSKNGLKTSEFWSDLYRIAEASNNLWIISYRTCRIWNLLSLWEEIENGRVTISGTDAGRQTVDSELRAVRTGDIIRAYSEGDMGGVRGVLRDAHGYIVCEDPPTIGRFRLAGQSRMIQWVDIRNYGVECSDSTDAGPLRLEWLTMAVQSISAALHTYRLGSLRATSGSQAMHGFRASYYTGGIYVSSDPQTTALEYSGYYGGRCECRYIGTASERVWHYDFRGAYNSVCHDTAVPVRCLEYHSVCNLSPSEWQDGLANAIATVDVDTVEPAYPYRRARSGGRASSSSDTISVTHCSYDDTDIIYPIGRFTTTLCGPELIDAITQNRVNRVHRYAIYEMDYALRSYASNVYNMRCAAESSGDTVVQQLAKRLAVCIAGKFGQRDRCWVYCPHIPTDILYGEWYGAGPGTSTCRYRAISGMVFRDYIGGPSQEAVPAIAAWITSAGRTLLLRAIRCAGWSEVYYYDTDSIFCTELGASRLAASGLVRERAMGYLQFQGTDEAPEFRGIKDYTFGMRIVRAGLPRGTVIPDADDRGHWYTASAADQARRGSRPRQTYRLVDGQRGAEYRHGIVCSDGTVTPIVLREW